MSLAAGERVGSYEILAHIGAGGMGDVYWARDHKLDRDVAVKVLPEHLAENPQALARFEREAKAIAALNHPNILSIHDFGQERGISFAVTELLEGETLRARLEGGPIAVRKAVDYALQISHGLAAAHDKGIIHRDLKPENLFITRDGRVKILDFGLAKSISAPSGEEEPTRSRHTDTGAVMGTAGYMSPEQVRGKDVDHRTDIFALGTILYEMLSGRRAFRRDSAVETMNAILKEEPPDISPAEGSIPPGLATIVRRCLEKTPEERFQSARDLGFALETISAEKQETTQVAAEPETQSIAVLPFTNLSPDPEQEYFCEGIAEEIINALTKVKGLRVAARTSSFQFKGKALDIGKAGEALKVKTVLEGSVRTSGNRLRVTAQLIKVDDGYHLWSERYDRQMEDVFDIQDEITSEIVHALKGTLLPTETAPQAARRTQDLEAYHFYLKGRYYRFTRSDFGKAAEHFQKALERDPSFASAYVGAADIYTILGMFGYLPPQAARTKAKEALDQALSIDNRLGEAYATLGYFKLAFDWDWEAAETAFRRGIELNPAFVPTYSYYGYFLACMGRLDEALETSHKAQELDPLSPHTHALASLVLLFASKNDEAILRLQRLQEMHPDFPQALYYLSMAYSAAKDHEKAIVAAEKGVALTGGSLWLSLLGDACALGGQNDRSWQIIRELEERAEKEYVAPISFVYIYMGLSNKEEAISWLETAHEQRDPHLVHLKHPIFDPIRSDPRFQDLLRRMRLD